MYRNQNYTTFQKITETFRTSENTGNIGQRWIHVIDDWLKPKDNFLAQRWTSNLQDGGRETLPVTGWRQSSLVSERCPHVSQTSAACEQLEMVWSRWPGGQGSSCLLHADTISKQSKAQHCFTEVVLTSGNREKDTARFQSHHRSYRDGFLRVKWPNQQCQCTEGR